MVVEPLSAARTPDAPDAPPTDAPPTDGATECIEWTEGDLHCYYYAGPSPKPFRPESAIMTYGPGKGDRGTLYWPYTKLERKAIRKARKRANRAVTWLKLRRFGVPPEGGWPEPEFVSAPAVADAATERERQRKAGA